MAARASVPSERARERIDEAPKRPARYRRPCSSIALRSIDLLITIITVVPDELFQS